MDSQVPCGDLLRCEDRQHMPLQAPDRRRQLRDNCPSSLGDVGFIILALAWVLAQVQPQAELL